MGTSTHQGRRIVRPEAACEGLGSCAEMLKARDWIEYLSLVFAPLMCTCGATVKVKISP